MENPGAVQQILAHQRESTDPDIYDRSYHFKESIETDLEEEQIDDEPLYGDGDGAS